MNTPNQAHSNQLLQGNISQKQHQKELNQFTDHQEQFYNITEAKTQQIFDAKKILQIFTQLKGNNYGECQRQKEKNQYKNKKKQSQMKGKKEPKFIKFIPKEDIILDSLQFQTKQLVFTLTQNFSQSIKHLYSKDPIHIFRFEQKKLFFKNCCFAYFELQKKDFDRLQIQEKLIQKWEDKPSMYIHQIVNEVDEAIIKNQNKNERSQIGRQMKLQWEYILTNMMEIQNVQLRRKIITKLYTAEELSVMPQMLFYHKNKRDQLLEKKKKYLAEFVAEEKQSSYSEENVLQYYFQDRFDQCNQNSKSKIIDSQSIKIMAQKIQDFLEQIPNRMLTRIKDQLKSPISKVLQRNYYQVFEEKINS